MSVPNPIPAPNDGSAIPGNGAAPIQVDWRASLAGENAAALEALKPFEKPEDFLKSWQSSTSELTTLKALPDWRKQIAGDDPKAMSLLERYSTPKDFGKAYQDAMAKIRSGELAKPLAADAKPEEVAEWRKANGIPENPADYFKELPGGRVIGKDDQPMFDEVAKKLHARNVPPGAMHDLVEWYYGQQDAESAKVVEAERAHAREAEDKLREAWGTDYRANESHLENYINGLSANLQHVVRDGFGPDGKKLAHNPEFKQWLSNIAREFNPFGMVSPGGHESQLKSVDAEIADLLKLSQDRHSKYWKGPDAAGLQNRHIQLLESQQKLRARAG